MPLHGQRRGGRGGEGICHDKEDDQQHLGYECNEYGNLGPPYPIDLINHINGLRYERVDEHRRRCEKYINADIKLHHPCSEDLGSAR